MNFISLSTTQGKGRVQKSFLLVANLVSTLAKVISERTFDTSQSIKKKVTENLGPEGIFSDTLKNTTTSNLEQSHALPALKYWFKISMGTSRHGYTQEVKRVSSTSMT